MKPGPQFDQLAMFHTAAELKDTHVPGDLMQGEHPDNLWKEKTAESRGAEYADLHGGNLISDIKKNGIHSPVDVFLRPGKTPELADGHHRVAAAYAANQNTLVPVTHSSEADDDWSHANYKRTGRR